MKDASWRTPEEDVTRVAAATHPDPFSVLGLHSVEGGMAIRAFIPGVARLEALIGPKGTVLELERRGYGDFFEGFLPGEEERFSYRLRAEDKGVNWEFHDPYTFGPVLGPMDDHLLVEGTHQRLYERLGAHALTHEGVDGVLFAVWAPQARRASVVGDFNNWDGRRHTMRKRVDSGIWELFAPGLGEGTVYKFEIIGVEGNLVPLKADPFGFAGELRPSTASIVRRTDSYVWGDEEYMAHRPSVDQRRSPMSIYEVHLGSWRRGWANEFLTYDQLAEQLIPYVVEMGFTHMELLPVSEHPLDASWGYQPIGLFAPTSRFGDPEGFQRFVDAAHKAGLGVILDWVPAHFPTDEHGLARFDGAALYEHPDPRRGFHPDWNTAIYDFGRKEVASVLISNALYWLDRFHIDGLRVDAVASMLYLDYSRKPGEWLPNSDGGNENRDAVRFMQRVNEQVYGHFPGATMIAEESTSWGGVSHPTDHGGLGFGFKWNMGWMNDTLAYMHRDPIYRRWHHDKLTFGLLYAWSENFILPISHDEVVHGKGSVVNKMPGDEWQQFANARAYYGFMWGYPGKKLLFMGQEFGQRNEWNFDTGLDWWVLEYAYHRGLQELIRDLNKLHREKPALHARDCEPEGFQWVVVDDAQQSVFAWLRNGGPGSNPVLVVSNLTPEPRHRYRLGLPFAGRWNEIFNSDAPQYGGSGMGNLGAVTAFKNPHFGFPASAEITIPPLATVYFEFDPG